MRAAGGGGGNAPEPLGCPPGSHTLNPACSPRQTASHTISQWMANQLKRLSNRNTQAQRISRTFTLIPALTVFQF